MAHHLARLTATDADLQAREGIIAKVLEDGLDAIMATCRAFFAEAEGAERQGHIVVDDEHLLGRPFVEREDLLDGPPAKVHECLGFEQIGAACGDFRQVALPFWHGFKIGATGGGEAIEDHEADIMAGSFILFSRISKADDEGKWHGAKMVRLKVSGSF